MITITIYNKKSKECITVAIHTKAVIVDHNNIPISNVKLI
ncbi:hypothetical protein ABH957_002307 [Bacillus sp. RC242]|uniref:Uncharacterized protein n=1 Tax=Bacillus mycoides TaxID=1405 RepID=A0A654AYZ3_BACMY|nr:conserved hypothetical protein [Bacillus mycoides]